MSNDNGVDKKDKNSDELMNEIKLINLQKQELEKRENLLLRDLRVKMGKSFLYEGKVVQIRRRGTHYYLCKMFEGVPVLDDHSEENLGHEEPTPKISGVLPRGGIILGRKAR